MLDCAAQNSKQDIGAVADVVAKCLLVAAVEDLAVAWNLEALEALEISSFSAIDIFQCCPTFALDPPLEAIC